MNKRNSNIELLRIIAMSFIVMGHFICQNELIPDSNFIDTFIFVFLGRGHRIAVNIFLIIGIWFLFNVDFKWIRIAKLYGQVLFYCWPLTVISFFLWGSHCSVKDIIKGVFPFWGRALWFATAYITLILIAPYLNKILEWNRKKLTTLVIFAVLFVSVMSSISNSDSDYICDSMWFVVVYIIIGYVKKYQIQIKWRNIFNLVMGMAIYLVLVWATTFCYINSESKILVNIGRIASQYLSDIKSLPSIAIAYFIFEFFNNMKNRTIEWVNFIAKSSFSVYIFHQTPAFYPILWNGLLSISIIKNGSIISVILVTFLIYFFVSIIDILRRYIEPIWLKIPFICRIGNRLNKLYCEL